MIFGQSNYKNIVKSKGNGCKELVATRFTDYYDDTNVCDDGYKPCNCNEWGDDDVDVIYI